jgi:hypothetical protein
LKHQQSTSTGSRSRSRSCPLLAAAKDCSSLGFRQDVTILHGRHPHSYYSHVCPVPTLSCPTNACLFTSANPPLPPRTLATLTHSAFGFFCHTARTTRLTIKLPASPVEHAFVGSHSNQIFSPHARCSFSPTTFACVHYLLGSPRWLLSFAFALRSPHSALVLQASRRRISFHSQPWLTLVDHQKEELLWDDSNSPGPLAPEAQHNVYAYLSLVPPIYQDRGSVTLRSAAAPSTTGCVVTGEIPARFAALHTTLAIRILLHIPGSLGASLGLLVPDLFDTSTTSNPPNKTPLVHS